MYIPKQFIQSDESKIKRLIEKNGFVTILSYPLNEKPFINHLPIILSNKCGEENILLGHMSRHNPQWKHFNENPDCTIIVNGGHSYISPTWYNSGRDVPTWNYAVAHLHGKIKLIEDFKSQIEILTLLSDFYENKRQEPWEFKLPDDLNSESTLTSAIISFKFEFEKIEAKFKLAQHRSREDRDGIINGLLEQNDDNSRILREMMLE